MLHHSRNPEIVPAMFSPLPIIPEQHYNEQYHGTDPVSPQQLIRMYQQIIKANLMGTVKNPSNRLNNHLEHHDFSPFHYIESTNNRTMASFTSGLNPQLPETCLSPTTLSAFGPNCKDNKTLEIMIRLLDLSKHGINNMNCSRLIGESERNFNQLEVHHSNPCWREMINDMASHQAQRSDSNETNGCIDLSINGSRSQGKEVLSVNPALEEAKSHQFPLSTMFNLSSYASLQQPNMSTPILNRSSRRIDDVMQLNSPYFGCSMDTNATGLQNTTDTIERTSSEFNTSDSHDLKTELSNNMRRSQNRAKNRKSGFQAGVTVGYTYDAFFVSDGRSRRKSKEKQKSVSSNRSRNGSGPTSFSSSSGHSNSSCSFSLEQNMDRSMIKTATPSPQPQLLACSSFSPYQELTSQRYTCPDCGKSYATSSNLSRHKQTHRSLDSQAARKCPHCGKVYVSMPALSMHILTHDLKHRCDLCGKAFSRPWLLQGHRRAHTGEKPYGCAHCGRAFADRSNLRAHMQTHSGMKHYECKRCHKSFALKSYLNKHFESACVDPVADEFVQHSMVTPEAVVKNDTTSGSILSWGVTKLIDEELR